LRGKFRSDSKPVTISKNEKVETPQYRKQDYKTELRSLLNNIWPIATTLSPSTSKYRMSVAFSTHWCTNFSSPISYDKITHCFHKEPQMNGHTAGFWHFPGFSSSQTWGAENIAANNEHKKQRRTSTARINYI
jgi:hypothetical protein